MIRLAVSLGEPAGIGPEILLRMISGKIPLQEDMKSNLELLVFAPSKVLYQCNDVLNIGLEIQYRRFVNGSVPAELIDIDSRLDWQPGRLSYESAQAAWRCLDAAMDAVLDGAADALVTGPIHKANMLGAGFPFPGHTEYLARRTGTDNPVMLYHSDRLITALVTTHIPLAAVPVSLTIGRIRQVIRCLDQYLRLWGVESPVIAVAGLNPHAGSGDVFGPEEESLIIPAIAAESKAGIDVRGPFAPDTVYIRAVRKEFTAVVSLYHDQGSIAVKTIAFDETVNVTLGIPLIRTSVDHGTALDIAGNGTASPENLMAAASLAYRLAGNRQRHGSD